MVHGAGRTSSATLVRTSGQPYHHAGDALGVETLVNNGDRNLPGSRQRSSWQRSPRHLCSRPPATSACSQSSAPPHTGCIWDVGQVPLRKEASEGRWTPSVHFIPRDTTLTFLEVQVSALSSVSAENVHLRNGESLPVGRAWAVRRAGTRSDSWHEAGLSGPRRKRLLCPEAPARGASPSTVSGPASLSGCPEPRAQPGMHMLW